MCLCACVSVCVCVCVCVCDGEGGWGPRGVQRSVYGHAGSHGQVAELHVRVRLPWR